MQRFASASARSHAHFRPAGTRSGPSEGLGTRPDGGWEPHRDPGPVWPPVPAGRAEPGLYYLKVSPLTHIQHGPPRAQHKPPALISALIGRRGALGDAQPRTRTARVSRRLSRVAARASAVDRNRPPARDRNLCRACPPVECARPPPPFSARARR